jgi:hypothetical protein
MRIFYSLFKATEKPSPPARPPRAYNVSKLDGKSKGKQKEQGTTLLLHIVFVSVNSSELRQKEKRAIGPFFK